ncbi:MAG: high-affinity iron transporter [Sphingomonadales bacterium]|nr:high-affinity iron transporter [Sphingomonadales bacterium]
MLALIILAASVLTLARPAEAASDDVQVSWRLLDYLGVDYSGAVKNGAVISASEYAEMREFAGSVRQRIAALPPNPAKPALVRQSDALVAAIARKADPAEVQARTRALKSALLAAYPVALAPPKLPDLARGEKLFNETCAACHGAGGDAKTPMAAKLDPPPVAFVDRARADQRSPFALYQVIDQGIEGTAMASFSSLPAQDRWDLAYYVSRFAYPASLREEGKRIWQSDSALRRSIPDLAALSGLTEKDLAARIGPGKAASVIAYLRANPGQVTGSTAPLALARQRLAESLAAYRGGDRERAKSLALSAYLDGFEPVEGILSARNATLLGRVETAMGALRSAIAGGASSDQVAARVADLNGELDQVESALAPSEDTTVSTFVGAMTILLREGLEALLIVVGMLAFLRKGDRPELVRPVHYGWVSAIVAGVGTWWAATSLVTISGATRELTEGLGSILAALVLLFVGVWMHGKGQADEWQRYIRQKMGHALSKGSAWFLFSLAFIAVYREIFETILFYAALSAEGGSAPVVAGAAAGATLLAIIAVVMLRSSQRLPIAKFFSYSSILIAVLAVVLAGKGVAALQEAGLIGVVPLPHVPRVTILGLFPSVQPIAAQLAVLAALLLGFGWNRRVSARRSQPA